VVDEHQVGINGSDSASNFLEFAFADERGGIRTVAMLDEFAGNLRAGRSYQLAELRQRFFNADAGDTTAFGPISRDIAGNRLISRDIARDQGAGRHFKIAVRARTVTELQSYEERPFGTITTSLDPGRRLKTAGTLPRNRLALRLAGTALAFRSRAMRAAIVMTAFGHDHG